MVLIFHESKTNSLSFFNFTKAAPPPPPPLTTPVSPYSEKTTSRDDEKKGKPLFCCNRFSQALGPAENQVTVTFENKIIKQLFSLQSTEDLHDYISLIPGMTIEILSLCQQLVKCLWTVLCKTGSRIKTSLQLMRMNLYRLFNLLCSVPGQNT